MIDIESIGSRVKYHRLRNKISQEELAELAQVSRVHISYLERGERIPSMESFINIANALNVSADELLANNLLVTGSNMNSEEQNILFDCSVNERQILLENMRKLKDILRSYSARIDRLSEYMASCGKTYKNHLATIRSWARKDAQRNTDYHHGMYTYDGNDSL